MNQAKTNPPRRSCSRRRFLQGGMALLLPAAGPAWSQGVNVTRLIVPFTPGASNDIIGRMIAEAVGKKTGRGWIVENKAGAGSMVGADFVAKAAPDGQTLLLCATANMGVLPAIQKSMPYAVEKDFTFFVRIASTPYALTVNSQLKVANFAEFLRLAKAKPGSIRIGASGVGALDYMGASLLQSQLGLDLNIVPYKGMSPVLNDLRGGHIDASIVSPATIRPLAQDGKVRVLAVLDRKRNDLFPSVPNAVELGHPQLLAVNWYGIAGPARIQPAVVSSLRQALMAVLTDPDFLKSLKERGFDLAVQSGDEFTQFVLEDLKRWKAVAKQGNITVDSS